MLYVQDRWEKHQVTEIDSREINFHGITDGSTPLRPLARFGPAKLVICRGCHKQNNNDTINPMAIHSVLDPSLQLSIIEYAQSMQQSVRV